MSEDTPTPTKAQFITQAEKVCESAENEVIEGARAYVKKHPGTEEEDMIVPVLVPSLENEVAALKALGLPEGSEAKVEAIVTGFDKAVKKTKEDPQGTMVDQTDPFKGPDKLAENFGFRVCANLP